MASDRTAASNAARVRRHRAKLRAEGLRPVQLWIPDVHTPEFTQQARDQSELIAASASASDDQAFIDAMSVDEP